MKRAVMNICMRGLLPDLLCRACKALSWMHVLEIFQLVSRPSTLFSGTINIMSQVALNYLESQPRPGQMEARLLKMAGVK